MSDFPDRYTPGLNRGLLVPYGDTPLGELFNAFGQGYSVTATTWTANRAVFQPIHVEVPCTVTQIAVRVQTTGGNLDVGIYNWNDTLLVSLGSTAVAAAGIQTCNITDTYLAPGWYKLAFSCNSSTPAFKSSSTAVAGMRVCGVQEQASAFALPSPATPIAYATALAPMIVATVRTAF